MQKEPTLKASSAPPRWPPSLPSPGGSHSAEFCADHSLAFYENQSMCLQLTHPGPTVHVLCHSTVSIGASTTVSGGASFRSFHCHMKFHREDVSLRGPPRVHLPPSGTCSGGSQSSAVTREARGIVPARISRCPGVGISLGCTARRAGVQPSSGTCVSSLF